jgi:hypothetical protein
VCNQKGSGCESFLALLGFEMDTVVKAWQGRQRVTRNRCHGYGDQVSWCGWAHGRQSTALSAPRGECGAAEVVVRVNEVGEERRGGLSL